MCNLYTEVIKFYMAFIKKLLNVHDFKSPLFHALSYLDPSQSQSITSPAIDLVQQIYPVPFSKQQVKFEMSFFKLMVKSTEQLVMLFNFGCRC